MARWSRMVWIWLLVLAVPAQSVAAATMAFCAVASTPPAAVDSAPCHQAAELQSSLSSRSSSPTSSADEGGVAVDLGGHTCSACAACCAAMALFGSLPLTPVVAADVAVFFETTRSVDPFAASGPDRPPRTVPA